MSGHKPITQRPPSLTRIVRRTLLGIALGAPLTSVMNAAPAWGQTAATRQFDIPSGTVNAALAQFATAAQINVSFDPAQAQGQLSPGLHGVYTVDSGLRQLLSASKLQAVPLSNGSYSLIPVIDATLQLLSLIHICRCRRAI